MTDKLLDDDDIANLLRIRIAELSGHPDVRDGAAEFRLRWGITSGDLNYAINGNCRPGQTRFTQKMLDIVGVERVRAYRKVK